MDETFERVTERHGKSEVPVRHLYRRQYQTASGDWRTIYYGVFTDWKGKRRKYPLGSDLTAAKDGLSIRLADNVKRVDFDDEKKEKEQAKIKAMTLAEYLENTYLPLMKSTPSYGTKTAQCAHLKRLLGHLPLSNVNKLRIMEYKNRRLSEPLMRHGKPVKETHIKGATVNRELSCLIAALNLAAEGGLCEGEDVPRIKKKERETEISRKRTLSDAEYGAILDASPRWLQRVVIAANEAALDQSVLLGLTWNCVRDGLIIVNRNKTEVRQVVGISPALNDVLDELRAEYRRVPNTERMVFTRGGKRIPKATLRHAFDKAVHDAKIEDDEDFQFRDFRHCARTRWALAGLPFEVAEIGLGHKLKGMAGTYTNLSDDQVREAFKKMFPSCSQGNQSAAGGNK